MILLPKGFIYVGDHLNSKWDYFFLLIGIIGAFITLFGLSQSPAQIYYVIGSSLLLITSIYFRLFFFIFLEIILITGHGVILLGISSVLQLAFPILLCFQLLVFYYLSGQLNNIYLLIGITGIALLSVGFAHENQWIFFFGSTAIAAYAFYNSRNYPASLLWAVLNTLFAIIAVITICTY